MKNKTAMGLCALLICLSTAGCSLSGTAVTKTSSSSSSGATKPAANTASGTTASAASGASASSLSYTADVSDSDTNTSWGDSDTQITLNSSAAAVSGSGASADGGVVIITAAGTYVLSGTLENGQIVIAATSSDKVHLVLNGAAITNKTGAAIYASQCDKLIVTLAEGTENQLTDGGSAFQYADTANEEPNAALFCKDDLTINGTGSLTVSAGFNNGIGTKDDLLIVSGKITVDAANHALRGNDSVTVLGGSLTLNAANDGIQTNNTEDTSLGWILIEGGEFMITAGHDGVQADTAISISDGTFNISTGEAASTDSTSDSYKGIKATGNINITGGQFTVDSTDDGIHANGTISVDNGTFTIASGDDGIHADGDLTINAGTIAVTESFEGLEAANIVITGGDIDLVSSDDGLNAAGGADQSGSGGRFGKDSFSAGGAYSITISGGDITLTAGGDGVDSNDTVAVSGGKLVSIINSSSDNGAVDCDGTMTFTGGTIIYGGTGTGSSPDINSTQSYVFVSAGVTAGNELTVQKDGQVLISYTPTADCKYLAFSSSEIQSGESYEVYSGGALLATVTAGTGSSGGMGGGMGGGMKGGRGVRPS